MGLGGAGVGKCAIRKAFFTVSSSPSVKTKQTTRGNLKENTATQKSHLGSGKAEYLPRKGRREKSQENCGIEGNVSPSGFSRLRHPV